MTIDELITTDRLEQANLATQGPIWIDTTHELEIAANIWQSESLLAIDTEFIRERTYWAALGLVQIANNEHVWLLDMPKLGKAEALAQVLGNPQIIKVLHSGSEDLEVLQQELDSPIKNLFDTQVGAALLGHPLQIGYAKLIESLFSIHLPKGETRSNWLIRPLSPEQILYAANDVAYLVLAAEWLMLELQEQQRWSWLQQDMLSALEKASQKPSTDTLYFRVKGAGGLSIEALSQLQKLATWRDKTAQRENKPRGFIIKDDALTALAEIPFSEINELSLKRANLLSYKQYKRYAPVLLELLQQPVDHMPAPIPGRMEGIQQQQMQALKTLVAKQAEAIRTEPAVLCSRRILEAKLRSEPTGKDWFNGWRGELLNESIQNIIQTSLLEVDSPIMEII